MSHEDLERAIKILVDPDPGLRADPDIAARCLAAMRGGGRPDVESACLAAAGRRLVPHVLRMLRDPGADGETLLQRLLDGDLAEIRGGRNPRQSSLTGEVAIQRIDEAIDEALRLRCGRLPSSPWVQAFLRFDESLANADLPHPLLAAKGLAGGDSPLDVRARRRFGLDRPVAPSDPAVILYRIDPALAAEREGPYTIEDRDRRERGEIEQARLIEGSRTVREELARRLDERSKLFMNPSSRGRKRGVAPRSEENVERDVSKLRKTKEQIRASSSLMPEASDEECRQLESLVERIQSDFAAEIRSTGRGTPVGVATGVATAPAGAPRRSRRWLVPAGIGAIAIVAAMVIVWILASARHERPELANQAAEDFARLVNKGDAATRDGSDRIIRELKQFAPRLEALSPDRRETLEQEIDEFSRFSKRLQELSLSRPDDSPKRAVDMEMARNLGARDRKIRKLLGCDETATPWESPGESPWLAPWERELRSLSESRIRFIEELCTLKDLPDVSWSVGELEKDLVDAKAAKGDVAKAIRGLHDLDTYWPGAAPDSKCRPRLEECERDLERRIKALQSAVAWRKAGQRLQTSEWPRIDDSTLQSVIEAWNRLAGSGIPNGPGALGGIEDWRRSFVQWTTAIRAYDDFTRQYAEGRRGEDLAAALGTLKSDLEPLGQDHELGRRLASFEKILAAESGGESETATGGTPPDSLKHAGWIELRFASLDKERQWSVQDGPGEVWVLLPKPSRPGGVPEFELVRRVPQGPIDPDGWPPWPFPVLKDERSRGTPDSGARP
jgi:hypothetical protein